MDWYDNHLATGSKDSLIKVHDVRAPEPMFVMKGHQKEVCGLKWNFEGKYLASGSNDNQLCIWDF